MDDDARSRGRSPGVAAALTIGAVALVVIVLDQVTKAIVQARIPFGGEGPSFGPFEVVHARNSGFVHGVLQGSGFWIGLATLGLLAAFVVYIARSGPRTLVLAVVFGVILGGGIGNLVDRLRLSYVTDFLVVVGRGPMNVADIALTLGLVALAILLLVARSRAETQEA
jgi:signal peptidase II